MNITYTKQGDYYIPDLALPKSQNVNIATNSITTLKMDHIKKNL